MTRTAVEKQAIERDGRVCRRCGKDVTGVPWSLQHRQPRGMGGGSRARYDRVENLVTLCGTATTGCHNWAESNRREAYETGWLVHRWDDAVKKPLIDVMGFVFLLTPDGDSAYTDQDSPNPGLYRKVR